MIAGEISNFYYPDGNKSNVGQTIETGLTVTFEGTFGSTLEEFWPDISRKLFHKDPPMVSTQRRRRRTLLASRKSSRRRTRSIHNENRSNFRFSKRSDMKGNTCLLQEIFPMAPTFRSRQLFSDALPHSQFLLLRSWPASLPVHAFSSAGRNGQFSISRSRGVDDRSPRVRFGPAGACPCATIFQQQWVGIEESAGTNHAGGFSWPADQAHPRHRAQLSCRQHRREAPARDRQR